MKLKPLFFLLFLFAFSNAWAQCDETFNLHVNDFEKHSGILTKYSNPFSERYNRFICKGAITSLTILNADSANLLFTFYKNDSILYQGANNSYKISGEGTFRVEASNEDCIYGSRYYDFIETEVVPLSTNIDSLLICNSSSARELIYVQPNFNFDTPRSKIKYQWKRNGIDLKGENSEGIYVSQEGIYHVEAKIGECTGKSQPVVVEGKDTLTIYDEFRFLNSGLKEQESDTIFLCNDRDYELFSRIHKMNWYKNGEEILSHSQSLKIHESGLYYSKRQFSATCSRESTPKYLKIGNKIQPPAFRPFGDYCTQIRMQLVNVDSYELNNKALIYNANNELIAKLNSFDSYRNNNFLSQSNSGKIRVEYFDEACYSEPVELEPVNDSHKIKIGKLVSRQSYTVKELCDNESVLLSFVYSSFGESKLYRNGEVIIEQSNPFRKPIEINITESGVYYFSSLSGDCLIISDTLEIVTPVKGTKPELGFSIVDCTSNLFKLEITDNNYTTYQWMRNDTLLNVFSKSLQVSRSNSAGSFKVIYNSGNCYASSEEITIDVIGKIKGRNEYTVRDDIILTTNNSVTQEFKWTTPKGLTVENSSLILEKITKDNEGTYYLETFFEGCILKDSINITIEDAPPITASFLTPFCFGENQYLLIEGNGLVNEFEINCSTGYGAVGYQPRSNNWTHIFKIGRFLSNNNEQYVNVIANKSSSTPIEISIEIPDFDSSQECTNKLSINTDKSEYCPDEKAIVQLNFPGNTAEETVFHIYQIGNYSKTLLRTVSAQTKTFELDLNSGSFNLLIESEDKVLQAVSPSFYTQNGFRLSIHSDNYYYTHCSGFSTPLTLNTQATDYFWKRDGKKIPNSNQKKYNAEDAGLYTVQANYYGCTYESTSIAITVDSIPSPLLLTRNQNYSFCKGSDPVLELLSNFSYSGYQWTRNGQPIISSGDSSSLIIKQDGFYSLSASQGICTSYSQDSVWVEFNSSPIQSKISINGSGVLENSKYYKCDSSMFTILSTFNRQDSFESKAVKFQWQRNGQGLAEKTSQIRTTIPGKYRVKISSGECITYSNEIEVINTNQIEMDFKPLLWLYRDQILSRDVLVEDDIVKTCSSTPINFGIYYGPEPFYGWNQELYLDDSLIETSNPNNNKRLKIDRSGLYKVVFVSPDQESCIASTKEFVVEFIENDTLTLKGVDNPALCSGNLNIYSSKGDAYQWYFKDSLIGIKQRLMVSEEGFYTSFTKMGINCTLKKTTNITSNYANISIITTNNIFCEEFSYKLSLSYSRVKNIEWYKNDTLLPNITTDILAKEPGVYYAKYTLDGCEGITPPLELKENHINNNLLPEIDSLGICPDGGFQIIQAAEDPSYSYNWYFNDEYMESSDSSSIEADSVGTYYASISRNGCVLDTPELSVYELKEPLTATLMGDSVINSGDMAKLGITFTSNPPFSYAFTNGETGVSQDLQHIHLAETHQNMTYELASVSNNCGEGTVSGTANIQVLILANEPEIGNKIVIYPNPTLKACVIKFDLPELSNVSYSLANSVGKILQTESLGLHQHLEHKINLADLALGEYIITLQIGKEKVSRKIIKY